MKLLIMQSFPASFHFFLLRSKYHIRNLFSDTFNLRSSLNLRDQVSHPHNTEDKITISYVLISKTSGRRREREFFSEFKVREHFPKQSLHIVACEENCENVGEGSL
jgi:hypothetical protein